MGPAGPAGSITATTFYTRSLGPVSVPGETTDFQRTISCLSGDRVISGGFSTNNNVEVYRSAPNDEGTAWTVLFKNPTSLQYGASVYAICADLP